MKQISLAEEARIIRREARRVGCSPAGYLNEHRRGPLRDESRATHLARAFLGGWPRCRPEPTRREPDPPGLADRVATIAQKYQGRSHYHPEWRSKPLMLEEVKEWMRGGQ